MEKIPVWPTKSMLSHTGAAAGAIDAVIAAKAIAESRIGPAKNCDNKASDCRLNISGQGSEKTIGNAMCCSYTFGGQTAAIVIKKVNSI